MASVMNWSLNFHIRIRFHNWSLISLFFHYFNMSLPFTVLFFLFFINLCFLNHISTSIHTKKKAKVRDPSSSSLHWEPNSRRKNLYLQKSQSNHKSQSTKVRATKKSNQGPRGSPSPLWSLIKTKTQQKTQENKLNGEVRKPTHCSLDVEQRRWVGFDGVGWRCSRTKKEEGRREDSWWREENNFCKDEMFATNVKFQKK